MNPKMDDTPLRDCFSRTLGISIGGYGGFYFRSASFGYRWCIGWIAFDFMKEFEFDVMARRLLRDIEAKNKQIDDLANLIVGLLPDHED